MIAVTDTISQFFVWWFSELAACVPGGMREFFWRRSVALSLTPGDGDVTAALHRGGSSRSLGRIRFDATLEPRRALAQLMRGISVRSLDVIMNLPADRVLRRNVNLPLAAQENLREVLAFEMDRHTPFKAGEVAFDYRVTGVDTENKRLSVDLAVVPRELLEQASGIASSFGLTLDRISIAGEESQGRRSFNFLPRGGPTGHSAALQRLLIALVVLASILTVIMAYMPLHMKQRALAAYETQLAETRAAALDAEQMKERLTARLEHGRFLIDRRLSTPAATALLAEVTDLLPDDTWLVQLRWQSDKLVLSGFSPAAAALIAGLEESPLLSDVRFGSPVTADPRVGHERFNISINVVTTPGG